MIEIQHLTKTFTTAGGTTEALKDVSLTIPDGEIYGIIGMSGAGKSTLVRSINMLERPTSGKIVIDGRDMAALSEAELRAARRDITMIFQGFNLLMQRTCQRNVAFPLELAGMKRGDAMKRAAELLEDAVLALPTAGGTFTRAEVDDDPVRTNSLMGLYTNHCNLLDFAAIAVPEDADDHEDPFGITLFALHENEHLADGVARAFFSAGGQAERAMESAAKEASA